MFQRLESFSGVEIFWASTPRLPMNPAMSATTSGCSVEDSVVMVPVLLVRDLRSVALLEIFSARIPRTSRKLT